MDHELEIAVAAAREAGSFLKRCFESGQIEVSNKSVGEESQGLVTQADLHAERLIIDKIQSVFPNHAFLAEESAHSGGDDVNMWVIDPLDGTNNFAHGIPHFAVSIGFCVNGETQMGVIFDPMRDDLFHTMKGQGAYHDGSRVHVNRHQELSETMLAVGFYYDRGDVMRRTLKSIERLFEKNIHGIRRMGTAALDLVQVGLGRFGGYFEYTLSPWDFAAARLFVTEAGGRVTTCTGDELPLAKSSVLASNGFLHNELLQIVDDQSKS